MENLDLRIEELLKNNGLTDFRREPLQGDASNRRYERIFSGSASFMLMIAPPNKEDIRPFINVDQILLEAGLNAPNIVATDAEAGLLLLEDFGDDTYSNVLREKDIELEIYQEAINVLESLPAQANIPTYTTEKLIDEAALFIDWYLPSASREGFCEVIAEVLNGVSVNNRIVLRDYHADNLMWLPEEEGLQKVGLLDFQDALIGNVAYDYVSLLEDARRDVSAQTVQAILKDKDEEFLQDYAILGAQRNLKIIGIFNRLAKRDGRDRYLQYLPRVWAHLRGDLQHEALAPLRIWMQENVRDEIAA